MKRTSIYLACCFVIFAIGFDKRPVLAQEGSCNQVSHLLPSGGTDPDTPIDPLGGVSYTVEKGNSWMPDAFEVKNVVVFGQDPDEEGVNFTVTVNATTGTILHDEWETRQECTRYTRAQNNKQLCNPGEEDPTGYYYYKPVQYCHKNIPSPATRHIKNVRIWLEPDSETVRWLGWLPEVIADKASLRYMFPEKWMVATWAGEGFITQGTPDASWSETYYENWLAQMQDYNFLAGDSQTIQFLWSVTLDEVPSPATKDVTALGVFGDFQNSSLPSYVPRFMLGSNYTIDYSIINSRTQKKRAYSIPDSPNSDTDVESITIQLFHIPLDLPGKWYIGVMAEMEQASFDYGKRHINETPDPGYWGAFQTKWIPPDVENAGFIMDGDNYFYSYVLLSTPCNDLEQDNCWDNTY